MERRAHSRLLIDIPVLTGLKLANGRVLPAMLVDVSRGGIQLALSPETFNPEAILGNDAVITELPGELSMLVSNKCAFICWVSSQRCGLRFYTPLAEDEEYIKTLTATL